MAFLRALGVLAVVLVGVLASVSSLVTMEAVAPPIPCNPFTANFFVYGGYGGFTFGNQKVTDGTQYTFNWKCGQTFSVKTGQIASGWKFAEWFSSSGSFANPTATSTSFYPAGGPVAIEMVLNRTTNSNAAGYVLRRGPSALGTLTEALTSFYLPTSVAMHAGDTTEEIVSVWAGLGGVNGPSSSDFPWAGGIDLVECGANFPAGAECSSSGFALLWFYSYGTKKVTSPFQSGVDNAGFLGDQILVNVQYSTTNATGWIYMKDLTHSGPSFSKVCTAATCSGFSGGSLPTVDSAEFVVTGGGQGPASLIASSQPTLLLPSFDHVRFSAILAYANSAGTTLKYDDTTDNAQWWHQQSVTLAGNPVSQTLYPSVMAYNVEFTVAGPSIGYPGTGPGGAPPDVQIAVGPRHVVEVVNTLVNVWNRAGVLVQSSGPQAFFATGASDGLSDPRILYDGSSGRWFASILDMSLDTVYLRVSQTSDPTLGWYTYTVSGTIGGVTYLQDQPLLGVSGDKVVISSNDFYLCNPSPCGLRGVQIWIASKADLISGLSTVRSFSSGPTQNSYMQSFHPVQTFATSTYGATNTLYLLSQYPPITIIAVTGLPPSLSFNNQTRFIANYMTPTSAQQKGSSSLLDAGDARIQDAFWQAGNIWLTFGDGCYPSGDSVERACFRITEICVDCYGGPTVLRDFDTMIAQKYLLYPSFRPDIQGNLYVVFGYSSATDYPGIMTSYLAAGAPLSAVLQPPAVQVYGTTPVTCGPYTVCRYGDYFGSAADPVTQTAVWVAAEYGGSSYGATYVLEL